MGLRVTYTLFFHMGHKLYDILGLPKGASKEDVKRAYRKLAVQHHPDKGGDSDKFKEISNAYSILNDDEKKARYDQIGDAMMENGGGEHMDPRNVYEQFFRGSFHFDPFEAMFAHERQHQQVRCNDHLHQVKITLSDAYHGITKSIRIGVHKTCFRCKDMCNACQGRGTFTHMVRTGIFTRMSTRPCDICSGTGQITVGREGCSQCQGQGSYKIEEKKDIHIPKGIHNGVQVRIQGMGEQPKREGDVPGDLIIQIVIADDPHFVRTGNDLVYRTNISFKDSIIGTIIKVPHFAGEFDVDTTAWGVIQGDKPYVVEKKGMPSGEQETGKLHIIFNVEYPSKAWSNEQRNQLEECFKKLELA